MTVEDLRAAVLAVPGVFHAEVALRDDHSPVVRVWTDGSRGDAEVRSDVADVIAIHGYGSGRMDTGRAALRARIAETTGAPLPGQSEDPKGPRHPRITLRRPPWQSWSLKRPANR